MASYVFLSLTWVCLCFAAFSIIKVLSPLCFYKKLVFIVSISARDSEPFGLSDEVPLVEGSKVTEEFSF